MYGELRRNSRERRRSSLGLASRSSLGLSRRSSLARRNSMDSVTSEADMTSLMSDAASSLIKASKPLGGDSFDPISVEELWAENQELYDRISELESRLAEAEAGEASQAAEMGKLRNSAVHRLLSEPDPSSVIVSRATTGTRDLQLRIEELVEQRSRLRWQKAILSVRVWNSRVKTAVGKVNLTGIQLQSRRASTELAMSYQRSLHEKEAQFAAERRHMCEAFTHQRTELEDTFTREMTVLRAGSRRAENHGVQFDADEGGEDDCGSEIRAVQSLADDLGHRDSCSSFASSALSFNHFEGEDTVSRLELLKNESLMKDKDEFVMQAQQEEIVELKAYSLALEEQLAESEIDQEELALLRDRIAIFEAEAGKQDTSWWGLLQSNLCVAARNAATAADAPPSRSRSPFFLENTGAQPR